MELNHAVLSQYGYYYGIMAYVSGMHFFFLLSHLEPDITMELSI